MKKLLALLLPLLAIFSFSATALADQQELRVGMEASYPPFNWTQKTDANGAVKIDGSDQYANGYDVQIAKILADKMDKKLVIVKTKWDGLVPALTSNKIDAIIAGMSPTPERRKQIDFSLSYYNSQIVMITNSDSKYSKAKSLDDFKDARVTAQQGTFHYNLIDQIPGVKKEQAMSDFGAMRVALESGTIDAYVGERPEGVTAEAANDAFHMVEFPEGRGFKVNPDDTQTAIGVRRGDQSLMKINDVLAGISVEEQQSIMDQMVALETKADKKEGWWSQVVTIAKDNAPEFTRAAGMTLFISLIGTIIGTIIGLLIGVFRTAPKASNKFLAVLQKLFGWLLNIYIEVFRGTPMIVQAMVFFYGSAQLFDINMNRTLAGLIIVSVNTGAYMSEIVRGGINSVDKGQFEAASALGMNHSQTMRKIVIPQVIKNILPATGNEFVINIKDTSVLNVISVAELFFEGNTVAQQNYQYFQTFAIISAIYFLLTFIVTRILRLIEKKLDSDTYTTGANQMQVEAKK